MAITPLSSPWKDNCLSIIVKPKFVLQLFLYLIFFLEIFSINTARTIRTRIFEIGFVFFYLLLEFQKSREMYSFKHWCFLCAGEKDVTVKIAKLDEAVREHIGQFSIIVRILFFVRSRVCLFWFLELHAEWSAFGYLCGMQRFSERLRKATREICKCWKNVHRTS